MPCLKFWRHYKAWDYYRKKNTEKEGEGNQKYNHYQKRRGGQRTPKLKPENGNFDFPKRNEKNIPTDKMGNGYTSIRGRVERPKDWKHNLQCPQRPHNMAEEHYDYIITCEFKTMDGGINIHAGKTANEHSTGCFIIGLTEGNSFNYQDSLQTDFMFKSAIYCAVAEGHKIKIKVNDVPTHN